jgi:glutathione S-transferase
LLTLIDLPISPFAQKVKLALLEKELPFEIRTVDLANYPAGHLEVGPRREVPMLLDDDLQLYDSSIIVEYLEEAYPERPLLPKAARERARVRLLEEVVDTQYEAVVWGVSELNTFQRASGELKASMLARASQQVASLNARLESELQGREWLNGEQFGFADIAAYPHVNGASSQGNKPAPGSRLEAWLRAVRARPSAQRCKQDIMATLATYLAVPQRIASGQAKRQYRDHRLEWVLRSGGLEIIATGLRNDDIAFSVEL